MKNIVVTIFLICCWISISYISPKVFAQGREWERARTGTTSSEEIPVSEGIVTQVEYFIAVDDVIEVFVWQNPDLSKDVIVGPDGKISYPLVGRIQAAGLTIDQFEEKMREGLSKYIKYPQVSVMMKKFSGNKIIILGEINYPGIYTYKGMINLIDAIALAGDFTDNARRDSVMIVSGNLTEHPEVRRINMSHVIKMGTSETNIILKPNDVVYVPKSFIANLNKFFNNINPSISSALSILGLREQIRKLPE